jgi:hypothetical protein
MWAGGRESLACGVSVSRVPPEAVRTWESLSLMKMWPWGWRHCGVRSSGQDAGSGRGFGAGMRRPESAGHEAA